MNGGLLATSESSRAIIRKMEARELYIHPYAQRVLLPSKLKQIKEQMDLDAIGVVHAVKYAIDGRDGVWVIDGQHRIQALTDLGLGEWIVEVKIHLDATTHERACALFLKLNNRSPVSPFDKFENELRAGFPVAVNANAIVLKNGLRTARHTADGTIRSVSALKKVYEIDSGVCLDQTLRLIRESWGSKAAALDGKLMEGISLFLHRYKDACDRPALIKKLAKYPGGPSGLLGDAKGALSLEKMSIPRAIANIVVRAYNTSRRTGVLEPL